MHIVGYLKRRKKLRLIFDSGYPATNENWFKKYYWFDFYKDAEEAITPNMPEARCHGVIDNFFVDAIHGWNMKDRNIQKGVLIFIIKSPIHLYSKSQTTVEASTFGADLCAMKTVVEMIEALIFKIRIFGI